MTLATYHSSESARGCQGGESHRMIEILKVIWLETLCLVNSDAWL
jgi:hypothetical protein